MNDKIATLIISIGILLFTSLAFACGNNEYESCWRVDLGPLGEAKDCKCYPKIGGDVGKAGEEAKRTINNLANELRKTPEAIQACINDVPKCANEIISAPLAFNVQLYIEGLYRQSEGRSFSFSPEFINLAQPYYSVDLARITWANDIDTGTGMSVSYCDRIFFAGHGNLWQDSNELHHVLHELEHTVQCQRRGKRTYLAEYVLKASFDVVKTGRFNVHDIHDYEIAAEEKANYVTNILWSKIQSGTVPVPRDINIRPQSIPVRFCHTPSITCSITPTMVPMGSACYCNSPYGQLSGTAF